MVFSFCQKNVSSSGEEGFVGVAFLVPFRAGLSRCVKFVCCGLCSIPDVCLCGMGLRRVLSSSSLNWVYWSSSEGRGLFAWPRLLAVPWSASLFSSSKSLCLAALFSLTAFCSHTHTHNEKKQHKKNSAHMKPCWYQNLFKCGEGVKLSVELRELNLEVS